MSALPETGSHKEEASDPWKGRRKAECFEGDNKRTTDCEDLFLPFSSTRYLDVG